MKLYKVTQECIITSSNTTSEKVNEISEQYFLDFKGAKKAWFRAKKHYMSCKPECIEIIQNYKGIFKNFWSVEVTFKSDKSDSTEYVKYSTRISEIETVD